MGSLRSSICCTRLLFMAGGALMYGVLLVQTRRVAMERLSLLVRAESGTQRLASFARSRFPASKR